MNEGFKYYNKDKEIFKKELKKYLPSKIIDAHVHLGHEDQIHFGKNITDRKKIQPYLSMDTLWNFGYKKFLEITKYIFPNIEYDGLFFGVPIKEFNIKKTNDMIKEEVISKGGKALFIPTPDDDERLIEQKILKDNFIGLKPYPDLAIGLDYDNQDNVSIFDFLTEKHLNVANKYRLIVLLHIPKTRRLNDRQNLKDILNICSSFPNISLILAHAGRSYCLSDIVNCLKKLSTLKNLYIDTAMINNWEVMEFLLENFDHEKIIYGSDLPIAILRGKNVCINNNHYFVTSTPFPWSLSNENLKEEDLTFFIYEEIREIIKALLKTKMDHQVLNNIFYRNIENIIKNIYI